MKHTNTQADAIQTQYKMVFGIIKTKFPTMSHDIVEDSIQHGFLKYYRNKNDVRNPKQFIIASATNYLRDVIKLKSYQDRSIRGDGFADKKQEEPIFSDIRNETLQNIKILAGKKLEFLENYIENFRNRGTIKTGASYMRFLRLKKFIRAKLKVNND